MEQLSTLDHSDDSEEEKFEEPTNLVHIENNSRKNTSSEFGYCDLAELPKTLFPDGSNLVRVSAVCTLLVGDFLYIAINSNKLILFDAKQSLTIDIKDMNSAGFQLNVYKKAKVIALNIERFAPSGQYNFMIGNVGSLEFDIFFQLQPSYRMQSLKLKENIFYFQSNSFLTKITLFPEKSKLSTEKRLMEIVHLIVYDVAKNIVAYVKVMDQRIVYFYCIKRKQLIKTVHISKVLYLELLPNYRFNGDMVCCLNIIPNQIFFKSRKAPYGSQQKDDHYQRDKFLSQQLYKNTQTNILEVQNVWETPTGVIFCKKYCPREESLIFPFSAGAQ